MKKERNYVAENARKKELNKEYHIALRKDIALSLDEKLKKENKTVSKWFRENAIEYLKN